MDRLTGSEPWDCDGLPLTPAMRREALSALAGMYKDWADADVSYKWYKDEGGGWMAVADQTPVATVYEFLDEYTGGEGVIPGWGQRSYRTYEDEFYDWLEGHLRTVWGSAVEGVQQGDGPLHAGWVRLVLWMGPMAAHTLLDRRAAVPEPDWRRDGF